MVAYDRKELDRDARCMVREASKRDGVRYVYRGWRIVLDRNGNDCLQAYASAPNGALVPFNEAI